MCHAQVCWCSSTRARLCLKGLFHGARRRAVRLDQKFLAPLAQQRGMRRGPGKVAAGPPGVDTGHTDQGIPP